jgi:hypothetical protein
MTSCGQEGPFEATFQIYNRWDTFLNEMDLAVAFCTNDSSFDDNSTWDPVLAGWCSLPVAPCCDALYK